MRERDIEQKLVREIRKRNGLALKWVSPGNDGVPDRIVILPGGRVWFVELKAGNGKVSPLQSRWIENLWMHGCHAAVVRGAEGLERFLEVIDAFD